MADKPNKTQAAIRHHVLAADANLQTRLGAVIRACRHQLGITQEELAWRADVHRTYITDIERGARNVTCRSLADLAKAMQPGAGNHSVTPRGFENIVRIIPQLNLPLTLGRQPTSERGRVQFELRYFIRSKTP